MALCEEGYLCDVCGAEVESIEDSDLYLRYVLGEVAPETLHSQRERHLRCNPTLAQFIVADGFEPVPVEGYFDKRQLDPDFVVTEEARITRGYLRLLEIPTARSDDPGNTRCPRFRLAGLARPQTLPIPLPRSIPPPPARSLRRWEISVRPRCFDMDTIEKLFAVSAGSA